MLEEKINTEMLIDQIPLILVCVDKTGLILWANANFADFCRVEKQSVLGMSYPSGKWFDSNNKDKVDRAINKAYEEKKDVYIDVELQDTSGELKSIRHVLRPFMFNDEDMAVLISGCLNSYCGNWRNLFVKYRDDLETLLMQRTVEYSEAKDRLEYELHRRKKTQQNLYSKAIDLEKQNKQMQYNERIFKQALDKVNAVNKQLKEAQEHLVVSEKMASLGQLAAGIAHEINNPLSFVKSNIASLKKYMKCLKDNISDMQQINADQKLNLKNEQLEELTSILSNKKMKRILDDYETIFHDVDDGIERVKQIVLDLKTYARADLNDGQEAVDVNKVIESSINIANNELKYKVQLEKKLLAKQKVLAVPSRLSQVFINLLVNSAHAIDVEGNVSVYSYDDEENVCVEIRDDGCGIPEEIKLKIFDPFFTTKPVGKGTGLGLSLCSEIIKEYKGSIKLESESGKGTSFKVILPAIQ